MKPFASVVVRLDNKYNLKARGGVLKEVAEEAEEKNGEPYALRSYFGDYLYEITHDYDGPVEGIVEYLKKNAGPSDLVQIPYGEYAVRFYNNLKHHYKLYQNQLI